MVRACAFIGRGFSFDETRTTAAVIATGSRRNAHLLVDLTSGYGRELIESMYVESYTDPRMLTSSFS